MTVLRLGVRYFAAVFTVGFLLGVVRVLAIEPALGARVAEIVELPIMVAWCWIAARWAVRRRASDASGAARLAAGILALAMVLSLELTVVLALRGLTLESYLAERDHIALGAYALSLLVFALCPWLVGHAEANRRHQARLGRNDATGATGTPTDRRPTDPDWDWDTHPD